MHTRVIIAHGWDDSPNRAWFPWLRMQLEAEGIEVIAPQLPDPAYPHIHTWVPALSEAVGTPDAQTFFIGHSMGVQAILRYAEGLADDIVLGGAVFVGGFTKRLTGLEDASEEVDTLMREWLHTPLDLATVRERLPQSIAIFSDNDHYVPLDNQDAFHDELGSEIIVLHKMGHFSGVTEKMTELPIAFDSLMKLISSASQ